MKGDTSGLNDADFSLLLVSAPAGPMATIAGSAAKGSNTLSAELVFLSAMISDDQESL